MCGIFGYIGKKSDAAEIVLKGLKTLEYRGYDSWGIAVKKDSELEIEKHIGKIGNANTVLPESTLGIGHTRWATHGGVTDINAHPHLDCKKEIALVHNGIVENHSDLRKMLKEKGHAFLSETDTEVISHLIEENAKTMDFPDAVRESFLALSGLNAIVVESAKFNQIVTVKTGSPIIIGHADGEFYIASDASAVIPHTRKLLFLEDKKMAILDTKIRLIDLKTNQEVEPLFEEINWKVEEADMGKYNHFMIKEIHEQSKVIRNIAKNYDEEINSLTRLIKDAKGTFFIGAGTAFHACLLGAYLFSKIVKIHVNTTVASEFNYLEDFLTKDSLIIALSQSGETIDVIEPLNRAKEKGAKIAAITNALGSSIYRISDFKMLLGAGPEKAVASTKAYIAKVAIVLLVSFALAGKLEEGRKLLLDAADEIDRILTDENIENLKKVADVLAAKEHIYTIGRGPSYPTALEAALKIKEVSYVHTEGLAGGELKHGTIALIEKGTPCIVFAPNDETFEPIISNATEIKARGGLIIGVSAEKSDIFDYWIEVKDVKDASVIAQVVPAQIISYYMTLTKGFDPDKPRNLAKSVTVK